LCSIVRLRVTRRSIDLFAISLPVSDQIDKFVLFRTLWSALCGKTVLDFVLVIVQTVRFCNAGRADLRARPNRTHDADASPERASPYRTPSWVKVFGVLAFIAIVIFAIVHLAGGGMGHMAHGGMDAPVPPVEHGQHRP
jgi:hypothetical protein